MKLKKIAFLFFCALILSTIQVNSQQDKDSLNYYRKITLNSENIKDLTKSFIYFKRQKEKNLAAKDIGNLLDNVWYISSSQYKFGAYIDSENSLIEGMEILDAIPNSSHYIAFRRSLINQLGLIKRKQEDYLKSLEYYSLYLKYAVSKSDSASAYNNIGVVYLYDKKYRQAKENFEKSYKFTKSLKDSSKIAVRLNNLGHVKSKLNDTTALKDLLESLKIKKIMKKNLFYSYEHLAEYYKDNKDTTVALIYAKKGYNHAKKTKSIPQKLSALRQLVDLRAEYQIVSEYNLLRDSVISRKLLMGNKYGSAKYDYTKEQNKRKESDAKAARNLFIALSVLVSSFSIFYIFRIRHKKEKLKTRFDTERQISKKLHDEVANTVFHTMSKQQNKTNLDIELIDDLEEIYLKTRDISKTSAALKITENFDEDLKDLVLSYKTDNVNIFTRNVSEIPWNTLTSLKKETVYRVLQELMINMKKHSNASLVTLQFQKEKRKITINYTDNGGGTVLKKSNGLQNVENRMKDIGGTIIFESETNKGFHVKMTV